MTFANPIFLWSMLGVLVPIAIHLWSKQESQVVLIGSIQLLEEQESVKSHRLSLNETTLLLLRILLITLLSLIISGPQFRPATPPEKGNLAILITPYLANNADQYIPIEAMNRASFIGVFEVGLPEWNHDQTYKPKKINYWELMSQVERLEEDSVIIISKQLLKNLNGKRPSTSKHITWMQSDEQVENRGIIKAQRSGEGTDMWMAQSTADYTKVQRQRISNDNANSIIMKEGDALDSIRYKSQVDWVPVVEQDRYLVGIINTSEFEEELFYIKKGLETIRDHLNINLEIRVLEPNTIVTLDTDLLVDLASSLNEIDQGRKILTYQPDEFQPLISQSEKPNRYYLTDRLNIENITSRNLVNNLLDVLNPYEENRAQLNKIDKRTINTKELAPRLVEGNSAVEQALVDGSNYFWMIFMVLLGTERILSLLRKQ
ncbi:MAG: BatA domain-containing protein [Bacteroidota bacterium]